ncbi:MAG: hypothetical protein H6598_10175 [Flavobacteriales bacterium]|nr:hypothetical protein [Flavobacteriales bacterium]
MAAKMWYEKTGEQVNIITIATPVYEGDAGENLMEDPGTALGQKAINDHIHLWNDIDGVQGGLAGDDEYHNSSTRNEEVYVGDIYSWYEWMDAHSFDYYHPETIQREIDGTKDIFDFDSDGSTDDYIDPPIEKLSPIKSD